MGRLNDREISDLMRTGLTGNRSAYHDFFKTILPMLTNMIKNMASTLPPDQCEDIVQEILTSIHAKRQTWDQKKPILPWVYAIARYRLIDHLRRQKRSLKTDTDVDAIADSIATADQHPDLRHDLERGIGRLGGQTEAVVRAMGLEGKDAKQTSRELNMSENAVRIAFHRGLKKLRTFFSSDYQER